LFTFGGGYAMIPLIRTEVVSNGYLTITQVDQFIGIAESTPGPFAINIATFVGFEEFGFLGAIVATLGVVLPSFIIIYLIAYYSAKFLNTRPVRSMLAWINPLTIGLIFAAAFSVMLNAIFKAYPWEAAFNIDYIGLAIFLVVLAVSLGFKKVSPILLIVLSGILGIILYSVF